jgi:hypothetical protein
MTLKQLLKRFSRNGHMIDANTSLTSTSRDEFKYREGDHELLVFVELLPSKPGLLIWPTSIKQWPPPYENEPITEEDRERILKKIEQYFVSIGQSYAIRRED